MEAYSIGSVANSVIVGSIPLQRRFKRYFLTKFTYMCRFNGPTYASQTYKKAREIIMSYIADENRLDKVDQYVEALPFRKNRYAYWIFSYADTQPHDLLSFFKLYTAWEEPLVSIEDAAEEMTHSLTSISVDTSVPSELLMWLYILKRYRTFVRASHWLVFKSDLMDDIRHFIDLAKLVSSRKTQRSIAKMSKLFIDSLKHVPSNEEYSPFASVHMLTCILSGKSLTNQQVSTYWYRFKELVCYSDHSKSGQQPLPNMYVDAINGISQSYESDLVAISRIINDNDTSDNMRYLIMNATEDDILFDEVLYEDDIVDYDAPAFVGQVHHIPKKGTTGRRSIAVPNRFIQTALTPFASYLYDKLASLPKDCTFNQSRFNSEIQDRLNQYKYVGSIDLHHATDYLPFSWGIAIIEQLFESGTSSQVKEGFDLFQEVVRGKWNNEGSTVSWTVGQPLGSYPSFAVLGLTHNLFLESISLSKGYLTSPYACLGDDVVVYAKDIRSRYISICTSASIPLSLHKSYEYRMVEFAGRIFIRNQIPRYTSDHKAIYAYNLFDYSRSTGIQIPWNNLSQRVRKDWIKMTRLQLDRAQEAYELVACSVAPRSIAQIRKFDAPLQKLFTLEALSDNVQPESDKERPWTVVFGSSLLLSEKSVSVARRKAEWFQSKFRPVTTKNLALMAKKALEDSLSK